MLSHPKASQLLGAMFGGGMFGGAGGGASGFNFEDEEMDQSEQQTKTDTKQQPASEKKAEVDPKAHLTEAQRTAEKEKELGNEAYKKKDFDTALSHYEKAIGADPINITYMTNKAGQ